jgi:membrane associated rhomboid family serine protease
MRRMSDQNVGYVIKPVTNTVLILANVVVFLYELALPPLQLNTFFEQWGAIPAQISQLQNLPTLFTAMFIHGSLAHIFGNMAYLKLFGDNIEDAMGHWSYLFFYLLAGLGAAATQVFIDPSSTVPMIGASGAIAGTMGAYLMLFPKAQIRIAFGGGPRSPGLTIPAAVMIVIWFVQQLFNGIASLGGNASYTGGVAFWAHVGGFLTGAVLVWLFKDQEAVDRQRAAQEAERNAPQGVAMAAAGQPPLRGGKQGPGRF